MSRSEDHHRNPPPTLEQRARAAALEAVERKRAAEAAEAAAPSAPSAAEVKAMQPAIRRERIPKAKLLKELLQLDYLPQLRCNEKCRRWEADIEGLRFISFLNYRPPSPYESSSMRKYYEGWSLLGAYSYYRVSSLAELDEALKHRQEDDDHPPGPGS